LGAIITKSSDINERVISLRNFGHHGEEEFSGLGINAKMSELHAAMGLCILPLIKERIRLRRERAKQYDTDLFGQSLSLQKPEWPEQTEPNFSYYPILFRSESDLLKVRHKLNKENIFPRRYFYPSLQYLPYLPKSKKLLVSDSVSRRVLCLPIHDQLPLKTVRQITKIIGDNLSRNR
jgi:dTDP-4-amino-4,6-dideoxygalactose transaminase